MEFSIPLLIGNIAQQFYNTADSIIVGRYVGDNALAAVGSAGPVLNILLVLFVGVATRGRYNGFPVFWRLGPGRVITYYWSLYNSYCDGITGNYGGRASYYPSPADFSKHA